MNAKELALQKHPMFFKVFMEVQRYQSADAIFEKFQPEWAYHEELRNLIRDVRLFRVNSQYSTLKMRS
jgi:hypothetical protein